MFLRSLFSSLFVISTLVAQSASATSVTCYGTHFISLNFNTQNLGYNVKKVRAKISLLTHEYHYRPELERDYLQNTQEVELLNNGSHTYFLKTLLMGFDGRSSGGPSSKIMGVQGQFLVENEATGEITTYDPFMLQSKGDFSNTNSPDFVKQLNTFTSTNNAYDTEAFSIYGNCR